MREDFIKASVMNFEAQIEKHRINVENLMRNSVGIGEHGDVMEEIEKELDQMANYDDKLEMLKKYFKKSQDKKILKD
jgi:hypothetical protein|tara:strand:+ start:196 stop:426 length:231 start_codon:yes stop_codon:yes gene_type:complete